MSPNGGQCDAAYLRPESWIEAAGVRVGGTVWTALPDSPVVSAAVVVSIDDPLTLPPAPEGAALVTGTFATTKAVIVDVWVEGLDKPIGATPGHPFWSLDRDGWASAAALQPGERLQTADGVATVACVTSHPGTETVYNLELQKDHTYFVSDATLWAHNAACSLRDLAARMKYKLVRDFPFNSHGQPVFKKGNRYITPDVDQHRGGVWKMFDSSGNRLGTYDANLSERIGP